MIVCHYVVNFIKYTHFERKHKIIIHNTLNIVVCKKSRIWNKYIFQVNFHFKRKTNFWKRKRINTLPYSKKTCNKTVKRNLYIFLSYREGIESLEYIHAQSIYLLNNICCNIYLLLLFILFWRDIMHKDVFHCMYEGGRKINRNCVI